MLLTVSKRLEFSASRRLFLPAWTAKQNRHAFGDETTARYGAGRNYVVWFVFTGHVDPSTGMLMNISEIKRRAGGVIDDRYDHRFLNEDNPAFSERVPTAENVARQLFADVAPLFEDSGAELTAIYLEETPQRSAAAYADGAYETSYDFRFSAARQTVSPHLTREENEKLFGIAASPNGHGHDYRVRLTVRAKRDTSEMASQTAIDECIASFRDELDHRNLNVEVPGLADVPKTTEVLARYIFQRGRETLPLHRVRLHERSDFFAEYHASGEHLLGVQMPFSAAHRLQSYEHTAEQNVEMYGKCNNARGHGHLYVSEATVGGQLDERSGTLGNFDHLVGGLRDAVSDWDNKHLDLETKEFQRQPSTGENIVQALWGKLQPGLPNPLERLRLWETTNNRFTLRRDPSARR